MAKLIETKREQHPQNRDAVADFGYFQGTPTQAELEAFANTLPEWAGCGVQPGFVQQQTAVADLAGVERWAVC